LPNQKIDNSTTRATARLPGLEVEIIHRRLPGADAEQLSINLQAVPSFEAFGQFLQAANPFAFWAQAAKLVWFPWLGAASAVTLPRASTPPMLSPGHTESGISRLQHDVRSPPESEHLSVPDASGHQSKPKRPGDLQVDD
jgi:hypothetical protein